MFALLSDPKKFS